MSTKTDLTAALPADVFWERALAESFGVSRSLLRKLRHEHLTADDWHTHENAVVITQSGLAKLRGVLTGGSAPGLAAEHSATGTCGPAPGTPETKPGPPEMRHFVIVQVPVYRIGSTNKHILQCRPVAADFAPCTPWELPKRLAGLVQSFELRTRPVRVKDNTNFRPGMVIEGYAMGLGMWQYKGRMPKHPGRWL